MTRPSLAFVLALVCLVGQAAAEEPEPYIVKFSEGRALLKQNKYSEALEKFQESAAIKPASGTYLNIGDCQEHLGRYASALGAFDQARALAAENKQPEREREAADRATKLLLVASSITVKAPANVKLTIDGTAVEPEKTLPVDGGAHVVHVEMPCKRPKDLPLTVGEKTDPQTVIIDPATLDADPACAPKTRPPGLSTERMLSYVAGGVGVVALGVGVGFGISAAGQKGELEDACPEYPLRCLISKKSELDAKYDDAHTAATISTIGFVGAIALIGGGVVLYVLSPEWKQSKTVGRPFVPGRFYF